MGAFSWRNGSDAPVECEEFEVIVLNAVSNYDEDNDPTVPGPDLDARITALEGALQGFAVTMHFGGAAIDETIFGYYKAQGAQEIYGAQIFAQDVPTGAALTLDLVNNAGTEQTKVATLDAGASKQETIFGTPLVLASAAVVQSKIKSIGSANPGQFITVNYLVRIIP